MRTLELVKTGLGATWAAAQAEILAAQGIEVHVAIPEGPTADRYRRAGATVHVADFGLPLGHPTEMGAVITALRRLVDRVRPDVVHSHFVSTTLTMRLALGRHARLPRVFQVPGPLHLEHTLFRRAEIASAGACDHWIGACRWTCDAYNTAGVDPARIHYSPYGFDLAALAPRSPGRLRAELAALGVAATTQIVGMVAYMYRPKRYLGQRRGLKGHEDLIDALARLRAEGRDICGVFVGGAWDGAADYEATVRRYGRDRLGAAAIFLGTRRDVPELFPDFAVCVVASHSENLGGAAEAQLAERPCVATAVGGLPDLVIDGDTGWLVPPCDPEALARTIATVLDNPAEAARRGTRGAEHARTMLDVRVTGSAVAAIYRQIVEARPTT